MREKILILFLIFAFFGASLSNPFKCFRLDHQSTTESTSTSTSSSFVALKAQLEVEKSNLTSLLNEINQKLQQPNPPSCLVFLRNHVNDNLGLIYNSLDILTNNPSEGSSIHSFEGAINEINANQLPPCYESIITSTTLETTSTTVNLQPYIDKLETYRQKLSSQLDDVNAKAQQSSCYVDVANRIKDAQFLVIHTLAILYDQPQMVINDMATLNQKINEIEAIMSEVDNNLLPACESQVLSSTREGTIQETSTILP